MATATHSGKAKLTLPSDTQILITREFDAPRRLVYRACTRSSRRAWRTGCRRRTTCSRRSRVRSSEGRRGRDQSSQAVAGRLRNSSRGIP